MCLFFTNNFWIIFAIVNNNHVRILEGRHVLARKQFTSISPTKVAKNIPHGKSCHKDTYYFGTHKKTKVKYLLKMKTFHLYPFPDDEDIYI